MVDPATELRPAQPLQNAALDVDRLSLQVSDDEALNEIGMLQRGE